MSDNTSRWAVIEGGKVINIILADADFAAALGAVPGEGAQIGWQWDGTAFTPPPAAPKTREDLKAERQAAVDAIQVTVSTGKTFDGDETSQTRMARAIVGMQAAGVATLTWVLADNTPADVTLAELTEALILAGQAQAQIWVIEP